jgi:hypothetical protein
MIHGDAMKIEYNAKYHGNAPRRIQCMLASVESLYRAVDISGAQFWFFLYIYY